MSASCFGKKIWPRGDATLKRCLDAGWTRARTAAELSRELRVVVTRNQVTNRGKRMGYIQVRPAARATPKIDDAPQRLPSFTKRYSEPTTARMCQQPLWGGKNDPCFGMMCGEPLSKGSSYCEKHRIINVIQRP